MGLGEEWWVVGRSLLGLLGLQAAVGYVLHQEQEQQQLELGGQVQQGEGNLGLLQRTLVWQQR
jgi:hypothetical protein